VITALLLAGVCASPLLWDDSGPPCADEAAECRCTECLRWDPVVGDATHSAPTRYEILRIDPDTSSSIVGTVDRIAGDDDNGGIVWFPPATRWCPARDWFMPREGRTYTYMVRACNDVGCSAWSNSVLYTAAPYAIDQFRPPIVGNP
jgi:hypothetical protein